MMKHVEQLELMEGGKTLREVQPISEDMIYRQQTKLAAISLAVLVSGLDEKQIYIPLGLDKATWSKICSGQLNFPTNKEEQFFDITGNEIPLQWLAYRRGYKLVPLEDAKERRIRELEEEKSELKKEIETLVKYGVLNKK